MIGETVMQPEGSSDPMTFQVTDVYYCAVCLEQAAQLVGSATQAQTADLVHQIVELEEQNSKLKDEVEAERQRFDNLLDRAAEIQRQQNGEK